MSHPIPTQDYLMTKREEHANNLQAIAELSGETFYRKMTFQEAEAWLDAYDCEIHEGYPHDIVVQRAWDYYFAGRGAFSHV